MCEDGQCDLDHDHDHDEEDLYIDEIFGASAAIAEFVENIEGFQYDE